MRGVCIFALMLKNVEKVKGVVGWGAGKYDQLMMWVLRLPWMRTYYGATRPLSKEAIGEMLHLTGGQVEEGLSHGFMSVAGEREFASLVAERVRIRAWKAALVTFLCALPQNWLMVPLMVVDIVFFQRQVFLLAQELKILYGQTDSKFNYTNLLSAYVVMKGVTFAEQLSGYLKQAVGMGLRKGLRYVLRAYRAAVRILVAQGAKWAGLNMSRGMIETAIELSVVVITSLVAGLVSYCLFVPMARRLEMQLKKRCAEQESEGGASGANGSCCPQNA